MVHCPLKKWAQLVALLAVASQYYSFPGRYEQILKLDHGEDGYVWNPLTLERVLGLGFEQVLQCFAQLGLRTLLVLFSSPPSPLRFLTSPGLVRSIRSRGRRIYHTVLH